MAGAIPRGSLPLADGKDFMCLEDLPGYVHILVGWRHRCKLDGQAAERLYAFVMQVIRDIALPEVLLDLSSVAYMNSQAVGIIAVRIARSVSEQGGVLHIYNPDPWVKQLICTLRLDTILPVIEKLPEFA